MTSTYYSNFIELPCDRTGLSIGVYNFRNATDTNNPTIENPIERERQAYESLRSILEREYMGQYVAIYGGNLVDSDVDKGVLLNRFYNQFGNVAVYIKKVGESERVHKVLTPFRR